MTFGPCIYFIAPVNSGAPIRIGASENPTARVQALMSMSPVDIEIIALSKGGRFGEAFLHREFAADRLRGEWFRPSIGLLEVVQAARDEADHPLLRRDVMPWRNDGLEAINLMGHIRETMFGMTVAEMAAALGTTKQAVSMGESGWIVSPHGAAQYAHLAHTRGQRLNYSDLYKFRRRKAA